MIPARSPGRASLKLMLKKIKYNILDMRFAEKIQRIFSVQDF